MDFSPLLAQSQSLPYSESYTPAGSLRTQASKDRRRKERKKGGRDKTEDKEAKLAGEKLKGRG